MGPRLPQLSGEKLVKFLEGLGYRVVRQRGSHVRLKKSTESGEHNITVPLYKTVAKGTLGDILAKVGLWNAVAKDELLKMLRK